ncbi:MAG TPA: hypothetical protein VG963_01145, partial [Polyangiaceae bacterium]|nr:hypothetical protein [Polyangiaceae bacterium]
MLLIVVPLSPGLSALLPSQGALAHGASQLPPAASIAIAGLGGVALALVLARLVRGVERQPYASIAPVLAVLFGLLHLSLRIELPLAGFPSAHVSGFVIALALLGGALVARASGTARLLGWTLVIVPSALVFAVVTTAQGQGSPASLSALNSPVRVSLGLLAGSALLLGLAGVFARWLLRKWGRSELADSWADWSSVPLPNPAAQVPETPSWGGQFSAAAGAEGTAGLHGTLLGWGAQPGQTDAQGGTYGAASENGYAYPQAGAYAGGYAGTSEAGYAYAQASDGYGAPQDEAYGGAQGSYDGAQAGYGGAQAGYGGAQAGYGYGLQTQASEYQGGQAYGYGGAAAGYGEGSAGAYAQEGQASGYEPSPSTYEHAGAGYGGDAGASYSGAEAHYGNAGYGNAGAGYGNSDAGYGNSGASYGNSDAGYGNSGASYGNSDAGY